MVLLAILASSFFMANGQVSPRYKVDTAFKFKENPLNIFPNQPVIGETEKGKIVRL